MFECKDSPEAHPKARKRSRKVAQNRNNSIMSSSPIEPFKDSTTNQLSYQSRSSLKNDTTDHSDIQKTIQKLVQEKTILNDLVASSEQELQFCNQIISQFIDLNELFKIKQNSTYDEKSQNWVLPKFIVQKRKTVLPKLQRNQLKEILKNEMKQRKIVVSEQNWGESKLEEDGFKDNIESFEGQGRPVTSISKYRQSSLYSKGTEGYDDSRRSPVLRKPKLNF